MSRRPSIGGRSHYPRYAGRGLSRPKGYQKTFDPTKLINTPVEEERVTEIYAPKHSFSDFSLGEQILANVSSKGFTALTPIQDQAIPLIIEGKDVIGIANTGTGKTAAFLIPLIDKLFRDPSNRILIMAPTRELADQINQEFYSFAWKMNFYSVLCIGGMSMHSQISGLRRKPACVIGTPGRLKDLVDRHELDLRSFTMVVLDEVDRMLDMGFIHDITYLVSKLPTNRQSLFFSATMPQNVRLVANKFLRNPIEVKIQSASTASRIDQKVIKVNGRDKESLLVDLLNADGFSKVLVFGGSKHRISRLERNLLNRGYKVAAIHGNKSQTQRMKALQQFKDNRLQALLASDIASRGLDIDDVTHVINYDMPQTYEDYIHRIGRTGRADKTGMALTFVD